MNQLQKSTIKKILREQFKADRLIIKHGSEKELLISEIEQKLSTINGLEVSDVPNSMYGKLEEVCFFKILSSSQYYYDQNFCLNFGKQDELNINAVGYWTASSSISHLEQVYTLVDKMKLEYKRLESNSLKRQNQRRKLQKINELKYKAIMAKINQIAKEDKFEFYLEEGTTTAQLLVRLPWHEQIEIEIPYNDFQRMFKNLRVTIQTIRDLCNTSGIAFKIRETGYDPEWISYE